MNVVNVHKSTLLSTENNSHHIAKNNTFNPSNPLATLPLKIFKQIFHSFSSLTEDELRKILDARSCARVFKQYMPNNVKFLQLYQPQKLQFYFDKLSSHLNKNLFSIDGSHNFLSVDRLEENYTHTLKLTIQKEDPVQTRLCIEKLGDIYLIKGTQQTLLQAAGLYNYTLHTASLKGQESIKEKLSKVEFLLSKACKGKPVDISITKKQFEDNRRELKKFRQEIEEKIQALGSDPSSEEVRMLYQEIAQWMKVFFKSLVGQAQRGLGAAPCEYAMLGFGSLARKEMTPYSDLEFGILMQEDTSANRDYFRRLTNLLHLKVINLGETILPALNIPCIKKANFFDSVTLRGFAFDGEGAEGKGCKTPFGNRQTFELIQTPEKMAQYIAQDEQGKWWHEKEPHLPMELLNFTHLLGSEELTEHYRKNVRDELEKPCQEGLDLCQYLAKHHLVQEDMETFNPGMGLLERQGMLFKVKNDLYRFPHLALDRLALLKKIAASDTFTRIDKLSELGVITEGAAEKLKDWMNIALFMRLKTYSHYQAQQEMMNPLIKPFGFDDPDLIRKQFALEHKALEKIKKIYRIFIPFYQVMQKFLGGHEESLKLSDLEDNSLQAQGNIALRLLQHKEAKKCYKSALMIESKNTEVLNALGVIYNAQGNLAKAAYFFEEALKIDFKLYGKNHSKVERNYTHLGMIYHAQGNLEKAIDCAKKAFEIGTKVYNGKHPVWAILYSNQGEIYRDQGDLKRAWDYASLALKIDSRLHSIDSPHVAMDYHNLGTIHQSQGNIAEAAKYINQALQINIKLYGRNHPNVATIYHTLATIYDAQMDVQKATEYAKKSLDIYIKFFGEKHSTVASNYHSLGMIYQVHGDVKKAAKYISKALSIALSFREKNPPLLAKIYGGLGINYQAQGKVSKAVKYAQRALEIALDQYDENQLEVVTCYSNLRQVHQEQGNLDKAMEYAKRALKIALNNYGENHSEVATCYSNLAQVYQEQGNLEEAIKYAKQALQIDEQIFGENHFKVAPNYNNLGTIYIEQNNLNKASKYFNQALQIYREVVGENHPHVAGSYNNLGIIYKKQGNFKKATKYSNKALTINLKFFGENHPNMVINYNNLGMIYQRQGNLEKAAEYTTKSLAIGAKVYNENHPSLALCHTNLGMIYQEQGDLEQAAKYIKKSLEINIRHWGINHPTVALGYNELGSIYQKQGSLEEAATFTNQALKINIKLLGENNLTVVLLYRKLAQIYKAQGNSKKAAEYAKKVRGIKLKP